MSQIVVADAGPLIALARTGHLPLLKHLFKRVLIPKAVADELELSSDRPGARTLAQAITPRGWLVVKPVHVDRPLTLALGPGETEAILLASHENALLLIDDRKGRRAATSAGIKVIGTGRVLIAAKHQGLLESVSDALDQLAEAGYRISDALVQRLRELAGEL